VAFSVLRLSLLEFLSRYRKIISIRLINNIIPQTVVNYFGNGKPQRIRDFLFGKIRITGLT
jgi:hypothetical protein